MTIATVSLLSVSIQHRMVRADRQLTFWAFLIVLALSVSTHPCNANPSATEFSSGQPNVLTVVLDDNYPPYIFRDASGTLSGYLVESWALWEKKTGVPVKLLASEWNLAQERFKNGQADVIDTVFKTFERERSMDFSPPYAQIPVSIYTHEKITGIIDPATLKGFLVGVKAGDACVDRLDGEDIRTLQPYSSYETLIKAAIKGDVRVFCLDEPPANFLLYREHAERNFRQAFKFYTGEFHRAVHKGDSATLALVEKGFSSFTPEEMYSLKKKWMGAPIDIFNITRMIVYLLLAPAIIGLVLAAWIAALRSSVRQRTEDLSATLDAIPDIMFEADLEGRYLRCYSREENLLAVPASELIGKTVSEVMPQNAASICMKALNEAYENGHATGYEIELTVPAGNRWFELSIARKGKQAGKNSRFVVLSRDITLRKEAEATVQQLAHYDMLTSLPNRILLNDRMDITLGRAKRNQEHFALMFLDLDRFKNVNDSLGHQIGDELLIQLAQRLRKVLRDEDTVSRLGGDEFIILLPDTDTDGAAHVAQKILEITASPYHVDLHELTCTSSIGIAIYPTDGNNFETLSMCADTAMYRAKLAGRNNFRFFTNEMQQSSSRTLKLENLLRHALEKNEFSLHFQPFFSLPDNRIVGAEALLRWKHPELGNISPAEFIPIAEDSGQILPIGEWVLQTAAHQMRNWLEKRLPPIVISVNLSMVQFRQANLTQCIAGILEETKLPGHNLELELTESMTMDNPVAAIEIMGKLRELGLRLSIDDFGTGYSSMSYLKRLHAHKLKIDQSFVRDLGKDPEDEAIVVAIIHLAQSLGMKTVAEGVETVEQLDFLNTKGCDEIQGYYFCRPLPAEDFEAFFRKHVRAGLKV